MQHKIIKQSLTACNRLFYTATELSQVIIIRSVFEDLNLDLNGSR